jgi:hypothetical protein
LLSVNKEETNKRTRNTTTKDLTQVWSTTREEEERMRKTRTETEVTSDAAETTGGAKKIEGNSLVMLQVNCRVSLINI